ncbi:MAG: response regulator [Bacteroidota bacterium]|nr:response regulator [Bacteroidota bacterium]
MFNNPHKLLARSRKGYIIAFVSLTLLLGINFYLFHSLVVKQKNNGKVILTVDKLRELEQNQEKVALMLQNTESKSLKTLYIAELAKLLPEWRQQHNAIVYGSGALDIKSIYDEPKLKNLLLGISPHYDKLNNAYLYLARSNPLKYDENVTFPYIEEINSQHKIYLSYLEQIQFAISNVNIKHTSQLEKLEWLMHFLIFALLLAQVVLIFAPMNEKMQEYIRLENSIRKELEVRIFDLKNSNINLENTQIELNNRQKKIQEQIIENEKLNRRLVEKDRMLTEAQKIAQMGTYDYNVNTGEIDWNEEVLKLFEIPEDINVHILNFKQFFTKCEYFRLISDFKYAIENDEELNNEYTGITYTGKQIILHFTGKLIKIKNRNYLHYIGVIQDYTTIRNYIIGLEISRKEAEDVSKAKSQFLSTMSHEIRTPMNAIIGFLQLIIMESPRQDQEEYLHTMHHSANHLFTLINDILDFNKIDAGKIKFEEIDFNLDEMLQNIINMFRLKASENNTRISLENDNSVKNYLIGDVTRLTQIFTNLLSNAVKFTSKGSVQIIYHIMENNADTMQIKFNVIDTGIGIAKDKQCVIFENFTQASEETTRIYGGTGLGLSISQKLVRLMHSEIILESNLGEGSDFSFTLIFKKGKAITNPVASVEIPLLLNANNTILNNSNILLVEDNKINQKVATSFLRKWGVNCDIAQNGQEAVELATNKKYDLILMDLQMPIMDGYLASKLIRSGQGFSKFTPIIALTASANTETKDEVLKNYMNDYITKPFQTNDLYKILVKNIKRDIINQYRA